jgi:hypothetical protein
MTRFRAAGLWGRPLREQALHRTDYWRTRPGAPVDVDGPADGPNPWTDPVAPPVDFVPKCQPDSGPQPGHSDSSDGTWHVGTTPTDPNLSPEDRVLAALRLAGDESTPARLTETTGLARRTVFRTLDRLVADGLVDKVGRGRYRRSTP